MSSLDPARFTNEQKALVGFGLAIVPAVFGLAIPGGVVQDRVELDPVEIFVATMPWTVSIAAITWFLAAAPEDWHTLAKLGVAVGILAFGAVIGVELVPEQAIVTEKQAEQVQYYFLAEQQGAVAKGGTVIAHSPRVGLGILAFGLVTFVVGVYMVLYGPALWVAGYACGLYLGWLLHKSSSDPGDNQAVSSAS